MAACTADPVALVAAAANGPVVVAAACAPAPGISESARDQGQRPRHFPGPFLVLLLLLLRLLRLLRVRTFVVAKLAVLLPPREALGVPAPGRVFLRAVQVLAGVVPDGGADHPPPLGQHLPEVSWILHLGPCLSLLLAWLTATNETHSQKVRPS